MNFLAALFAAALFSSTSGKWDKFCSISLTVLTLLGVWKFIEIIVWIWNHIDISFVK
jgi:hypothetical protein